MDLQTKVPIQPADNPIDYQGKVLLLGSCFVENMGAKFGYFQFLNSLNPFGIFFHPLAIENLVQRAVDGSNYALDEIFEQDGIWHCFDAHSELRSGNSGELLKLLNQRLMETRKSLETASHIIITLGTAWVYRHIASKKIVANCHKVPQREFQKELLAPEEIQTSLENCLALVKKVNPDAQFIFTVSPVRHLKNGFVENQRSKAYLITAVHEVLKGPPLGGFRGDYFPAYEIMMDELRDYRFYGKDMLHPNELAVDYIWEKFRWAWISPDCLSVMEEVDSIQKGLAHRPFNPDSDSHQKFRTSLQAKITYLQEKYPFMKFE